MTKRKQQQDEYAGLPPELAKSMRSLGAAIAAKQKRERANKPKEPGQVIRLPLWPEAARGAPNDILRSALFAAIQGKGRAYLENKLIAAYDGNQIKYTGRQLDQSDLDVWEQILHLARQHPLGTVCHFAGHAFLKSLARSTGKANYQWLHSALLRLSSCTVEFCKAKKIYGRGMIASYNIDETTRRYKVTIDPDTAKLYAAGWTAVDWNTRRKLRRKPLALWLHGYYSSHAQPLPVKVDTLRSLSGSKDKTLRSYRQKLRRALTELKAIGAIASWQINAADLVTVHRGNAVTPSQQRHLRRTRPRRKRKA
jgi:TrfA protein